MTGTEVSILKLLAGKRDGLMVSGIVAAGNISCPDTTNTLDFLLKNGFVFTAGSLWGIRGKGEQELVLWALAQDTQKDQTTAEVVEKTGLPVDTAITALTVLQEEGTVVDGTPRKCFGGISVCTYRLAGC